MAGHLIITGELSIEPCSSVEVEGCRILIMGPTGSGKSTFIESLASKGQSLGISKDQLAGFTQNVAVYKLLNARLINRDRCGNPYSMYLIDTPGFSDSKISEIEIISKVKKWMQDKRVHWIDFILYLCPVTDTRVPRSKRQTIRMLRSLLQEDSASCVTIITTMWDGLSNLRARQRAEEHFEQLRDEIWKEVISGGGRISRFHNTQESALDIIKTTMDGTDSYTPLLNGRVTFANPCSPFLYQELIDRINGCRQAIESLRLDQIHLMTKPDTQLESIVLARLQEVKLDLKKFLDQLVSFGTPPEGFAVIAAQIVSQHLLYTIEGAHADFSRSSDAVEDRLLELKVFSDDQDRSGFFYSCGPLLDSRVHAVIFEQLVKAINNCLQEKHSLHLDGLHLITEADPSIQSALSQNLLKIDGRLKDLQGQLDKYSTPPAALKCVSQQLIYQDLLNRVNEDKGEIQVIKCVLDQLRHQPGQKSRKSDLKAQLTEAKASLAFSALALIKFGAPPEGYERVVFNYRELSIKGCIAQVRWIAKQLFGKKD